MLNTPRLRYEAVARIAGLPGSAGEELCVYHVPPGQSDEAAQWSKWSFRRAAASYARTKMALARRFRDDMQADTNVKEPVCDIIIAAARS